MKNFFTKGLAAALALTALQMLAQKWRSTRTSSGRASSRSERNGMIEVNSAEAMWATVIR